MITWRTVLPSLFTVAAMLAGFYSLICTASGDYMMAAQMIMLSMLLDGFDGNVARWVKGTSAFGAELDTYVDMTSFGIAPAMLAYEIVLKQHGPAGFLFAAAIIVSGVMRLSRFRVKDPFRGQHGYTGLPITVNACWLSMFIFVSESGMLASDENLLRQGPIAVLVWAGTALFLVLQVSNVRYFKPTKALGAFLVCILGVLFLFLKVQIAVASALTICAMCFIYAFVTPFLPKNSAVEELLTPDDEKEATEPVSRRP